MEDYIINTTNHEDIDISELDKVIRFACKHLKVNNPMLNIVIVDKNRIQEINREYRDKDAVTDVISFAFEDDFEGETKIVASKDLPRDLGEIFICSDVCINQAKEYGHSLDREMSFLTCHGLLHLLGYDHMTKEDEEVMFGIQNKVMDLLKL